ncbi:NUAK family SNF1-like kinase 1 isoform X1 [Cetorhinus maximus]
MKKEKCQGDKMITREKYGCPEDQDWEETPDSKSGPIVKKHQHKHNLKHRYQILQTLGRGAYGKVKKAQETATGRTVAIKSVRKDRVQEELDRIHIQREMEIMSSLNHPNIIRINEVFENKDKIIIIMDYCSNGELYDYVNEHHRLSENEARKAFRQIVSAVHYCHKKGIVHRDLKLENILLDENFNVKLADFGLSNLYHKDRLLETYCGSPLYASPEIVNGFPYQGPEVDCWALGVLLYTLVCGTMPFDSRSYKTLVQQISHGEYKKAHQSSDACGLIDWMLTVNSEKRATIEDIANHWWVNWGYDTKICDCSSDKDCHSPLLARYIDWQNREGYTNQGMKETENIQGGESSGHEIPTHITEARQKACLKKSKKENDMTQPQDVKLQKPTSKDAKRKPKGILKTRSSFDNDLLSPVVMDIQSQWTETSACIIKPVNTFHKEHTVQTTVFTSSPKKGILKNSYQRESGYSSSPERSEPIDRDTAAIPSKAGGKESEMPSTGEVKYRKKGILKRNGKFSISLDLPDDFSSLKLSASLKDLIFSNGRHQRSVSRPSSVISDDSILSSDSFDRLDLTAEGKRRLFTQNKHGSLYSSASEEDLLELHKTEEVEPQTARKNGNSGKDNIGKIFSIMELEDTQDIYNKAQEICNNLKEK